MQKSSPRSDCSSDSAEIDGFNNFSKFPEQAVDPAFLSNLQELLGSVQEEHGHVPKEATLGLLLNSKELALKNAEM
jgi:hypothetical protein